MIAVHDLVFTYPRNSSPTIKGIEFQIDSGEIFGFLGPSGSGKSTTQKILTKLLPGYKGSVSVLGKPLENWDHSYYEHIGVGFELPNHYQKLTALENLCLFAAFYDSPTRDPMELLEMVGLKADAHKRVEDFSKGMQMRLNFIRALLHNPEILFFDEPTSGLDPVNARIMKEILLDLKSKGKCIFITTHNMHDADELCDRVAFIVEGEIALTDQPQTLRLNHSRNILELVYQNEQLNTVEFPLKDIGKNPQFLDLISTYPIQSIHSQEASLEDIFISVTGRRLS